MLSDIAIIGGSGLNSLSEGDAVGEQQTPFGHCAHPLRLSRLGAHDVVFLARHGQPHALAPHLINYRANLWALHALGVKRVLAVNAVGGIGERFVSGALVIPDQLIDYTWGRESTFFDGSRGPLQHIDLSYPYSASLREVLVGAARDLALPVLDGAVYAATQGPRLETAAEINRLERDGCDIVGMTAMPEAALARELGIEYAAICLVVNPAAGRGSGEITMADIEVVLVQGMEQVKRVLNEAVSRLC